MKKIAVLFLLSMFTLITIIGCKEKLEIGEVLDKLPSFATSIAYVNLENLASVEAVSSAAEQIDKNIMDFAQKNFKELYVGIGRLESILTANPDIVILISGKYNKNEVISQAKETLNMEEEVKVEGYEGLSDGMFTLIFYTDELISISNKEKTVEVINAVKGEGAIDKESGLYKKAKSMNADLVWAITNLDTIIGEVDLGQIGLPGIDGNTKFGITSLDISNKGNDINVGLSTEVDDAGMATNLSNSLNTIVPVFALGALRAVRLDAELKKDLETIVRNFKLNANDNIISINIELKRETLKRFSEVDPMELIGGF